MTYLTPDIVSDETAVAEAALAGIADRVDGFTPSDGGLTSPLAESVGVAIATAVTELQDRALDAYTGFGVRVLGLPRVAAALAATTSTWTLSVSTGYQIPAGTQVIGQKPDGSQVVLITPADVDVAAGTTVVAGVALVAVDAGADANGASTVADFDQLDGLVSITLDAPTADGADEQDPNDYADRLSGRAKRLHLLPMAAADYAAAALDTPGVARALAINRADPANPGDDAPGHITILALDAAGAPVAGATATALAASYDQTERPVRTTVHLADAALVDVTVAATVQRTATADPTVVQTACQDAIAALTDPAAVDYDADAPGLIGTPATQLTLYDVAAALDSLPDVARVTLVTINGADSVTLPAPLSLPHLTAPATITVTA